MTGFRFLFLSVILLASGTTMTCAQHKDLGAEYMERWTAFYPSKALAQGIQPAIFGYEDLSSARIAGWTAYNEQVHRLLTDSSTTYVRERPIDARLLRVQVREELDFWQAEPQQHSLVLYADLIARATDDIVDAENLTHQEKAKLLCTRLTAAGDLCMHAKQSLGEVDEHDLAQGLSTLERAVVFYGEELPRIVRQGGWDGDCPGTLDMRAKVVADIDSLIAFSNATLAPAATPSSRVLGRDAYARKLAMYLDKQVTPEQLAEMARREIDTVRYMIEQVSKRYLMDTYPGQQLPSNSREIVQKAFTDMEADAPLNAQDYLEFWHDLADQAVAFIEQNEIATLPAVQTLRIMTAPESAGPAARIGWVDSAAPFHPNPVTTLYLPSVPDSLPEKEQREFWASFNKPFNRMIVIHELFPGHYMQIKVSRETPHPVRLLFPYRPYFEGWATFCERVLLDAGWERDNLLTFLAHLRKRLENANRAYTSVMVHCYGWTEEQVMEFSTDTSWLAPQFAKSLWGRIMRSPMQLTSYYYGGLMFSQLLEPEKERLGSSFDLRAFMDTIMRTGPIPVDEFPAIFLQSQHH